MQGWIKLLKITQNKIKFKDELTVSQWAEKYRYLSSVSSAEPGKWRNDRTPYLVEIMDCQNVRHIKIVWVMAGAQLGKTEAINNRIGYIIHYDPAPTLMVMATEKTAKDNSKLRIDPMIQSCPELSKRVRDKRERDSGNTVEMKMFPGGFLNIISGQVVAGMKSKPVKNINGDEIDEYPSDVSGQGDFMGLLGARAYTFPDSKTFYVSTPTIKNFSNIEKGYLTGDQRKYHIPCPDCNHYQILTWKNFKWEKNKPETVYYRCEKCGYHIKEHEKKYFLPRGKWIPTNPDRKDKSVVSYHLPGFYSPLGWLSWQKIVEQWLAAQKDPNKLKVVINTIFAETFEDQGSCPDYQRLYFMRERYQIGLIPEGGIVLTLGADVQEDRIECEIVSWGKNLESWSVDKYMFEGDTSSLSSNCWKKLKELLDKEFFYADGKYKTKIKAAAIDAGFRTQVVYNFCRTLQKNFFPIMGLDSQKTILSNARKVDVVINGRKKNNAVVRYDIGVSVVKKELYGFLKQEKPEKKEDPYPAGWCHFPEYEEEYFKQLCAEIRIPVKNPRQKSMLRFEWRKIRPRNEALDMRVYARGAASYLGLDELTEDEWEKVRIKVRVKDNTTEKKIRKRRIISRGVVI